MDLTIVIPSYNTKRYTLDCVKSILENIKNISHEIIIVDNNSTDGSGEILNKFIKGRKNIYLLVNKKNLGFAKAVNQGIKKARGEYVLLLNSDTKIKKGSIKKLLDFVKKNKNVGVVAPRLINGKGEVQASVFHFPGIWPAIKEFWLGKKGNYGQYVPKSSSPITVDAVVGAAFLITPQALKKVGFFDERYFMYFEDLDYCRRVWKKGLKVYYLPASEIVHYHGKRR